MKLDWEYYWDEVKKRKFFIFGFFLVVLLPTMDTWIFLGPSVRTAQSVGIMPDSVTTSIIIQKAAILVIFAVSWDLLSGYSGQISFGHALFLGMGGYLAVMIREGLMIGDQEVFPGMEEQLVDIGGIYFDLSVIEAIILASALIAVFALVTGTIILRLKGPYFALVTLVLPLIAQILVTKIWGDFTGGDGGLQITSQLIQKPPGSTLEGLDLFKLQIEQMTTVILTFAIVCVAIMYLLARSRYGLVLKAIREDEQAASSSGINVSLYKVSVFVISSFFASVAGGLLAQVFGSSTSALFESERSFEIIIFSILGGIGTILGAIIGTFVLFFALSYYIKDGFVDLQTIEVLIFGLLLIIIIRYQPRGLINADPQLRNSLFFGVIFSFLMAFYDTGNMIIASTWNPAPILQKYLGQGERGFFGMDLFKVQGRMVLYFIVGTVIGYYGPELAQKIRLRLWGVWPSLGTFDPPK